MLRGGDYRLNSPPPSATLPGGPPFPALLAQTAEEVPPPAEEALPRR